MFIQTVYSIASPSKLECWLSQYLSIVFYCRSNTQFRLFRDRSRISRYKGSVIMQGCQNNTQDVQFSVSPVVKEHSPWLNAWSLTVYEQCPLRQNLSTQNNRPVITYNTPFFWRKGFLQELGLCLLADCTFATQTICYCSGDLFSLCQSEDGEDSGLHRIQEQSRTATEILEGEAGILHIFQLTP